MGVVKPASAIRRQAGAISRLVAVQLSNPQVAAGSPPLMSLGGCCQQWGMLMVVYEETCGYQL
jgi:hypothetical protein